MSKKRVGFEKLGVVVRQGDGFRARAQYRDDAGRLSAIIGPWRDDQSRAEADLAAMRAAGAVAETREQGLLFMAAEARRRQESAKF